MFIEVSFPCNSYFPISYLSRPQFHLTFSMSPFKEVRFPYNHCGWITTRLRPFSSHQVTGKGKRYNSGQWDKSWCLKTSGTPLTLKSDITQKNSSLLPADPLVWKCYLWSWFSQLMTMKKTEATCRTWHKGKGNEPRFLMPSLCHWINEHVESITLSIYRLFLSRK